MVIYQCNPLCNQDSTQERTGVPRQTPKNLHGEEDGRGKERVWKSNRAERKDRAVQVRSALVKEGRDVLTQKHAFFPELERTPRFPPRGASLCEATGKGQVIQRSRLLTAELCLIANLCTVDLKFFSPYDDLPVQVLLICFLPNGSSKTTGNCVHKILF